MKQPRWFLLRGRILVDRALQFNLVTRAAILMLFTFCIVNATLFAPFARELGDPATAPSNAISDRMLRLHDTLWLVACLCLAVAVGSALFLSHRIAGPLVRVKRMLRHVQSGRLPPPLTTRPKDYFKDEVQALNDMVASLATRIDALQAAAHAMHHAIDDGAARAAVRGDREMQRSFAQVHRKAARVSDLLAEFARTPSPGDGLWPASDRRAAAVAGAPPAGESPASERSARERPVGERSAGERSVGERPAGERPAGERPAGELPADELPAGGLPAARAPAGEPPAATPPAEKAAAGAP